MIKTDWHADENNVKIYELNAEHNCVTAEGAVTQSAASSQEWVIKTVSQYMKITVNITLKQIMKCIQLHFHEVISYKVAQWAKQNLLTNHLGHHHYAFQLLPAYLECIHNIVSGVYTHLSLNSENDCFQWVFICPLTIYESFK